MTILDKSGLENSPNLYSEGEHTSQSDENTSYFKEGGGKEDDQDYKY